MITRSSETKENRRREKLEEQIRSIVTNCNRRKIEGIEVDSWSAGIMLSVIKGLNEDAKQILLDKPIKQIFSICFSVTQAK